MFPEKQEEEDDGKDDKSFFLQQKFHPKRCPKKTDKQTFRPFSVFPQTQAAVEGRVPFHSSNLSSSASTAAVAYILLTHIFCISCHDMQ